MGTKITLSNNKFNWEIAKCNDEVNDGNKNLNM